MIVAWQFTAWDAEKNRTVPLGNGMIGSKERSATLSGQRASRPTHTVPTGRIFFKRIPGDKLPGYLHLVSSRQKPPGTWLDSRLHIRHP